MPTIKIVISSALAEKRNATNDRILDIALNQLNDEFELVDDDVTKERIIQVIQSKRNLEEQNWIQLVELNEEKLAELPTNKDTLLAELAEIIRQL